MKATHEEIRPLLRCPCCGSELHDVDGPGLALACTASGCRCANEPFPVVNGQPALIDFEDSILERGGFVGRSGASELDRRPSRLTALRRRLMVRNMAAGDAAGRFLDLVREAAPPGTRPRVLVVGGGTVGSGAGPVHDDPAVTTVPTDVYASPHTCVVADGHRLPFADGTFHGVWIQAVLEHVLEPGRVVAEIHRVLASGGAVYADTPFLQPVHEGAFDFTRFTLSGHRWLFRDFTEVAAGMSLGAGTAVVMVLRQALRASVKAPRLGSALAMVFFWFRHLDRVGGQAAEDAACGVWFLGRRSDTPLRPRDMVTYYRARGDG